MSKKIPKLQFFYKAEDEKKCIMKARKQGLQQNGERFCRDSKPLDILLNFREEVYHEHSERYFRESSTR